MTDDRQAGIALIAGSAGALATMTVHPTGAGTATAADYEHLALVSATAHSIGIVSVAIVFVGACGLAARLREPAADKVRLKPDPTSIAANKVRLKPDATSVALAGLVAFGLAAIAALVAAAVSGFIEPALMLRMVRDDPAAAPQWHIVIDSVFQINQAFARIFTVGASSAVLLWSIAAIRSGALGRGLATYGWLTGVVIIGGILVGHLRMNVHGMAIVVVAQTIWFCGAGLQLWRAKANDQSIGVT